VDRFVNLGPDLLARVRGMVSMDLADNLENRSFRMPRVKSLILQG